MPSTPAHLPVVLKQHDILPSCSKVLLDGGVDLGPQGLEGGCCADDGGRVQPAGLAVKVLRAEEAFVVGKPLMSIQ